MKFGSAARRFLPLVVAASMAFSTGCAGAASDEATTTDSALSASGFVEALTVDGQSVSYRIEGDQVFIRRGSEQFSRSFADAKRFADAYAANVTQTGDRSFVLGTGRETFVVTGANMQRLQQLNEAVSRESAAIKPRFIQILAIVVIAVVLLSIPGHDPPPDHGSADPVDIAHSVNRDCADAFVQPDPNDHPVPLCTVTDP